MRTVKLGTIFGATMMSSLAIVPFSPPVISEIAIGVGFSGIILSALSVAVQIELEHRTQGFVLAYNDAQTAWLAWLLPSLKTSELKDLCLYFIARFNCESCRSFDEFTTLDKVRALEVLQEKELISPANCKAEIMRIYHNQPSQRAIVQSLFQRYESDKA